MSAPTSSTVSEREAVLRERRADAKARCAALYSALQGDARSEHEGHVFAPCEACERKAADRYPLPTVTRPRVVTDHKGYDWRVIGRRIEWHNIAARSKLDEWRDVSVPTFAVTITADRIKMWADLLANPTETVEDDGSAGGAE